jgi:hypothetical protein
MSARWQPNAPAEQGQIDGINMRLASGDKDLSGTKYAGHTVAPPGLTRLQANQAMTEIDRLPYVHNECRGGEPCGPWNQCSRHSSEYQRRYGRAWNE